MNIPDFLSMDNDDESLLSPTPDDFVISTYRGNPLANSDPTKMHEDSKISFLNKCSLCRKIHENTPFTCSTCVNAGEFCSSKHNLCSTKQREMLLSMLTKDDYDEFQGYSDEKSTHLQCADRMFLLRKFNSQRVILQLEFEKKSQNSIKFRLIAEEIQLRKVRFHSIRHSIEKYRDQLAQKKKLNQNIQHHIDQIRARIISTKKRITSVKPIVRLSNTKLREKLDDCAQASNNLQRIRQQRLHELMIHLFPIQHLRAAEPDVARRINDLKRAQESINGEQIESGESPEVLDERYQIVNSFLPSNGKYHIENLVSIYNSEISGDFDSPQLSPIRDSHSTLAALSHACQLINIVAFYLNIKLPFYLHPWNFNQDELVIEHLRADIAKLNANIITSCLSQGIPIDFTNVSCTMENLLKLLTFKQYPCRPRDVTYPQIYIDLLNKEVSDVNRALTTSYWFDDDDDNDYQKQRTEVLDDDHEFEIVPPNEFIPDGSMSMRENIDSSPSNSRHQQSSVMDTSVDFVQKTGRNIGSLIRSFWS